MICPECRQQMSRSVVSKMIKMDFIDGESEFENAVIFQCKKCKIKFEDCKWEIPEEKKASEKQIKASQFIESVLSVKAPPPTKKALWTFINKYFDRANETKNKKNSEEEYVYFPIYDDYTFGDELPF